jgi:proteasome lid subunit RPN8/RPN11
MFGFDTQEPAPKRSSLGWDMDHTWLLRRGTWHLEGERRGQDAPWSTLRAQVEIGPDSATFRWEGAPGPIHSLELPPQRAQNKTFDLSVLTERASLPGRLETRGSRQFLQARHGGIVLNETFSQRADGTVEAIGTLVGSEGLVDSWRWILRPDKASDPWTIPASVVEQIEASAKAGSPVEQCGLLVGRPDTREILSQIGMINVDQSEDHFTIDSREQFKATRSLRGSGTDIVGSWHSHPFSPARLSDEDLGFAQDETALYAVLSLMDPEHAALNVWQVAEGIPKRVELRIQNTEEQIHQDLSEKRHAS